MTKDLIPKIRFKGYTEAWEQRKLKDIGEILTGSTPSTSQEDYYCSDGILWVTPTDIDSNIIKTTARKLSIKGEKVARIVPKNTILVTCIASIGKNALVLEKSSFNQQINSLTPFDKYNPYFLLTDSVLWSIKMKQQGAAGMMQIVNKNEFSEIETNIPSEEEQNKIGELYKQIDNLITLHQRKYDKLVELKKSLLEKKFPKNNLLYPETRFNGFTEAWEQRKLDEISNRFDNLRIPVAANVREKETIPNYGANGIQDYVKGFTHNGEFVLIAEDGANDLKNYPVKYVNGLFWANNHVHVIQGKKEICDNKYLKYCFSKTNIEALLVGGGRAKLNANIMMGIDLKLCQFDEQSKIGELFYEIDNLITLHQQK